MKDKGISPIRWTGGKSSLTPKIGEYYQKFKGYRIVEPFAGGLAISFSLCPEKALANDLNWNLINFYKAIKKDGRVSVPMLNEEALYYELRTEFNNLKKTPNGNERRLAELFYFLNRFGFNGLYRENRKGEYNVAWAAYKYSGGLSDLSTYSAKIQNWEFQSGDFSALKIEKNDFLFVDPPYDDTFTSYTKEQFSYEDQIRLVKWLDEVAPTNPVIITNQNTERMRELYIEYGYEILESKRPKNFKGKNSEESKKEIMAVRNVGT